MHNIWKDTSFSNKTHGEKLKFSGKKTPDIGLIYVYRPTVKGCCLYIIFFVLSSV